LARAVGLRRGVRRVVDATAGLGRDAVTLAALGAEVTMIEAHPVLAALLADGLARARATGLPAADRLHLRAGDAILLLAGLQPEAVLLDPMFPDRGKTALARREMQLCRELLGPGTEDPALLAAARAAASRRVVVKRSPRVRPFAGVVPDAALRGRRVRFDVYAPRPPA
jgi:16S rRNA (guanine1516-N2)-methyltransferase